MVDEPQEGLPIAVDVDHHDGLVVQLELAPGDDLERLVQRAEAAGQDGEGVRHLEHQVLARMHGIEDVQIADPLMADFAGLEKLRDDPDRSEEHTSELQSLMRISYAVFCLTKNNN